MNTEELKDYLSKFQDNSKKINETVDYYDLKTVLDDKYEVTYVTDLTSNDGDTYTAWFIHEKNEQGLTGKQIKDEKIYQELADKLKKAFPGEDIRVSLRQYKYAPEQVECMLLLPITGMKEYNNLKIGDKFKFDDEPDNVYEVQDITDDGYRECKRTDKNGNTNVLDIYPEDIEEHPITLIKDTNESVKSEDELKNLADEALNEKGLIEGDYFTAETDADSNLVESDEIDEDLINDAKKYIKTQTTHGMATLKELPFGDKSEGAKNLLKRWTK